MAFESELGNYIYATDAVASFATPALVTRDNVLGIVTTVPSPQGTNVVKVPKLGSLTAGDGSESTGITFSSNHELTDSATTLTLARTEGAAKITIEAAKFGQAPWNTVNRGLEEIGMALNRKLAADFKALFSSVSNSVDMGGSFTKDGLLEAKYAVTAAGKAGSSGEYFAMIDFFMMKDLEIELSDTGASAYVNQVDLGGVLGVAAMGVPRASIHGIDIYETDGLPTSGGNTIGCLWDRRAFAACVDSAGIEVTVKPREATEPWTELYGTLFQDIAEHQDTLARQLLVDTP